jgi:hypothetical protein
VYGPGATAQNADRRRIYANCPADPTLPCDFSTVAMLRNITTSSYHGGQFSVSRRTDRASGSTCRTAVGGQGLSVVDEPVGRGSQAAGGENDLAQNPLDLEAEYGPSLFDARHRFVANVSWQAHVVNGAPAAVRVLFDDWQLNAIASMNSGTPFHGVGFRRTWLCRPTARRFPGFPASRPNLVGDPNAGPRTVDAWLSRDAFQRLNVQTQAGSSATPAATSRAARATERGRLVRARLPDVGRRRGCSSAPRSSTCFNHVNFGLPVADLNSVNFGRIFSAGPPRLDAVRAEALVLDVWKREKTLLAPRPQIEHAVAHGFVATALLCRVETGHDDPPMTNVVTHPHAVRLSEVLGGLSYALDLTEGQRAGHAVRSCLIGMRLAESIGCRATSARRCSTRS